MRMSGRILMLILMVTLRFSIDVPSEASAQSLREKLVAAHDRSFPLPSGSPAGLWATNGWTMVEVKIIARP